MPPILPPHSLALLPWGPLCPCLHSTPYTALPQYFHQTHPDDGQNNILTQGKHTYPEQVPAPKSLSPHTPHHLPFSHRLLPHTTPSHTPWPAKARNMHRHERRSHATQTGEQTLQTLVCDTEYMPAGGKLFSLGQVYPTLGWSWSCPIELEWGKGKCKRQVAAEVLLSRARRFLT